MEVDASFSEDSSSDDDRFFDSNDENKLHFMDEDVFLPNIRESHSNLNSFERTTKIESKNITIGPCMSHFGKWIDVGETAMPHFNFAQKVIRPQQKISFAKI